jgi:hypothetical protein
MSWKRTERVLHYSVDVKNDYNDRRLMEITTPLVNDERHDIAEDRSRRLITSMTDLTRALRRRFAALPAPRGYVRGKTRIRNALMDMYGYSAMRAERLVDQLQSLGFIRYTGTPNRLDRGGHPWRFEPSPLAVR